MSDPYRKPLEAPHEWALCKWSEENAALRERVRVLEGERDAAIGRWMQDKASISVAIGTTRFMDPPDGGSPTLAEQVQRMREALTAAEERERVLTTLLERVLAANIAQGCKPDHPRVTLIHEIQAALNA